MTFYWIYDLPNWLLCSLIVATFVGLSLAGLFISRPIRQATRWRFVAA